MSKIKTVYTSNMVCHLWANRHPHNIRTASDNLYTRGGVLHSYGSHYVIGAFLDSPAAGAECMILWNTAGYSNTTNKHASIAWRALSASQRNRVVYVPNLNADSVQPRNLPELAKACINAAVAPLEKSKKARSSREQYLCTAANCFDSARTIYAYIGDAKAAKAVPVLESTATPAQVLELLASLKKADYMAAAAKHLNTGKEQYSCAVAYAEQYAAREQQTQRVPHPTRYSARAVCRVAVDAVNTLNRATAEYKNAGVNVPPLVRQLTAKAKAIETAHSAAARAEQLTEQRQILEQSKRDIVRELASYRHAMQTATTRKTGGTVRALAWRIERAEWAEPSAYAALWPDAKERETQRTEWENLRTRTNRILCAAAVASSIESTAQTIERYTEQCKAGSSSYSVPTGIHVTAALRKYAAVCGGAAPEYWVDRANAAARNADDIGAQHAARVAAKNAERIAAWRAGERVSVPRDIGPLVRIVGDVVETSYGATVPLSHAVRLVRLARAVAARGGMTYTGNTGPRVGHFQVNSIESTMAAVIGCHTFSANEAQHAAQLIETAAQTMAELSTNS